MISTIRDVRRLYHILAGCFFALMVVLTVILFFEYLFFKNKVRELTEIKNNYSTCIQALRRQIADYDAKPESLPQEKKKSGGERFVVVNRKPEYLKSEALKYARTRNLERSLQNFYDKQNPEIISGKKTGSRSFVKPKSKGSKKKIIRPLRKSEQILQKNEVLNELRAKVCLQDPLLKEQYWLSSFFGPRKKVDGTSGFHTGIDMAAVKGTHIKAAADGIISQAGYYKGYGNMVQIIHSHKVSTRYAHLDRVDVKIGDKITQGKVIGTVGNTGNVRRRQGRGGYHLHFETNVDGKLVNPLYFIQ